MNELRPTRLQDYIGQAAFRAQLEVALLAAKQRGEALDHVLLYGPPGLGKTTLAQVIATEMDAQLISTSAPILEKPGDLASMLTQLPDGGVLFIDEIHRLPPVVEEVLYSAMEDGKLDILIGDSAAEKKAITIELPRFTLVGATTRAGCLSAPLRDRFGIVGRLQFYTPAELSQIVSRNAELLCAPITHDAALQLADRSRGTPRIANRLLRRCRDMASHLNKPELDEATITATMTLLGIAPLGLTHQDQRLLQVLANQGDNPMGIANLAVLLDEEPATLEEVVEPYLIQQGLIQRTPRGRVITDAGKTQLQEPGFA